MTLGSALNLSGTLRAGETDLDIDLHDKVLITFLTLTREAGSPRPALRLGTRRRRATGGHRHAPAGPGNPIERFVLITPRQIILDVEEGRLGIPAVAVPASRPGDQ